MLLFDAEIMPPAVYRSLQVLSVRVNECYRTFFVATHHAMLLFFIGVAPFALIRLAKWENILLLLVLAVGGGTGAVIIEWVEFTQCDQIVSQSRRVLAQYLHIGSRGEFLRKVARSLPILKMQSAWIFFYPRKEVFMDYMRQSLDFLLFLLIDF